MYARYDFISKKKKFQNIFYHIKKKEELKQLKQKQIKREINFINIYRLVKKF